MFCIGKLVEFPRNHGKNYFGRIERIGFEGKQFVNFQKDEAFQDGALINSPKRVKTQLADKGKAYVAYNLDENIGKPNHVALLENVKPESLLRLIRVNHLISKEIDAILQEYCPKELEKEYEAAFDGNEVDPNDEVLAAGKEKGTENSNKLGGEYIGKKPDDKGELQQKTDTKDFVYSEIFMLINQHKAFDSALWDAYDDALKAKIICVTACLPETERAALISSDIDKLIAIEKKRQHQIIYALLLFLLSIKEDNDKKKAIWKEAHERLLKSISLAYRNGQKDEIKPLLKMILPICLNDASSYCDALVQFSWESLETYITCTQKKGYGSIPVCLDDNQNKRIWDEFTKPHLDRVKEGLEAPDLRDLLAYSRFDPNAIPNVSNKQDLDQYAYPYRISAFVLRLNEVWKYLSCRKCGEPLFPDFEYRNASDVYTLTKFTCKNYSGDALNHDYQTYLNYCYSCAKEKRGKKTIDSRECIRKTNQANNTGMWLCMRCGGARGFASHIVCPACGSTKITIDSDGSIICNEKDCRLVGALYGNGPVSLAEILRLDRFRTTNKYNPNTDSKTHENDERTPWNGLEIFNLDAESNTKEIDDRPSYNSWDI